MRKLSKKRSARQMIANRRLDAFGGDAMQSSNSDFESLAARVEKLERQNRWFKRAALALLLLPATLLVMGQARPTRTLEAQAFVLTDANGIKRADLTVPTDVPVLRFFNSAGGVTADLGPNGYSIFGAGTATYTGDKGPVKISIARLALGPAGLFFSDEHGKTIIELGGLAKPDLSAPPSPRLELFDSDERARVDLSAQSDFGPAIRLYDEAGNTRAGLGLTSDGPYVRLSDSDGFSAQMGSTDLVTPNTGERHKTSAASLTLFGKDNTVLWSAP
jgi:hypothetical protein